VLIIAYGNTYLSHKDILTFSTYCLHSNVTIFKTQTILKMVHFAKDLHAVNHLSFVLS